MKIIDLEILEKIKIGAIQNQIISVENSGDYTLSIALKREDLMHPIVSGNKFRKLKYNISEAKALGKKTILTFGGAFSNHIAAVAAAGKMYGFKTIGVIRGEEIKDKIAENPTLQYAIDCGMKLHFISREDYKFKNEDLYLKKLQLQFGAFYMLPEGGTNLLAVKGCSEIITELDEIFDYICVPVGTGGTLAGIVAASKPHQQIVGFSALLGTFQTHEVSKYTSKTNYTIIDSYAFGGYAKITAELVHFINQFKLNTDIQLDPIYTGKMLFGITDLAKKGYFKKNSRILAIHTGGLQGIAGMNKQLLKKNLPTLDV